jgi:hypothetical protein
VTYAIVIIAAIFLAAVIAYIVTRPKSWIAPEGIMQEEQGHE